VLKFLKEKKRKERKEERRKKKTKTHTTILQGLSIYLSTGKF